MKNIKYTLVASPENQDNPNNSKILFRIYGEDTNIDWGEGPRRERMTNSVMENFIKSIDRINDSLSKERSILAGFNKEYPKIHKKIMEYNISVSSNPKKGTRFKRGDFQRFEFGRMWNDGVFMFQSFIDEQCDTLNCHMRILNKYGEETCERLNDYMIDVFNKGEDEKFPKKRNGVYDIEKIADIYAAEHGIAPIEAAFCNAVRVTFVGSTTPSARSSS